MVHLSVIQQALAAASGAVVGVSLGLIGGGGSILAVPLLLYVVGYPDPHVVIGTTALAAAANAYLNLIPHARAGHVRWASAAVFALAGAAAAAARSAAGKAVNGQRLLFLFAILMLVVAVLMLRPLHGRPAGAAGLGWAAAGRLAAAALRPGSWRASSGSAAGS